MDPPYMALEKCRHCQVANFASTTIHGPVSNHHSNPLWNLRSCWWFHLLPQTVLHLHARSYNDSSVFQHLMLDTLCRHTNPPAHTGKTPHIDASSHHAGIVFAPRLSSSRGTFPTQTGHNAQPLPRAPSKAATTEHLVCTVYLQHD